MTYHRRAWPRTSSRIRLEIERCETYLARLQEELARTVQEEETERMLKPLKDRHTEIMRQVAQIDAEMAALNGENATHS